MEDLYNAYAPTNAEKLTKDLLYLERSIDNYGIEGTLFHRD